MKALLSGLLLGVSVIAHANDNEVIMNVSVKVPSFIVDLPANPTTGFQWSVVQYDKKLLILSANHYQATNTSLIGGGGEMHFIFSLQTGKKFPESTEIKFKYSRYWEPASAIMKKVTINFVK